MRSDQQQAINRLAGTSATAFLCAVLCVYPLYIDKFSNLGVTKFPDRRRTGQADHDAGLQHL